MCILSLKLFYDLGTDLFIKPCKFIDNKSCLVTHGESNFHRKNKYNYFIINFNKNYFNKDNIFCI